MPLSITPGSWHHQPSGGQHQQLVYSEKDGHTLAVVYDVYGGTAEMEANARAIAALPDLIAALESIASRADDNAAEVDAESYEHSGFIRIRDDAYAALRKAGAL